jgi:hypothetical protein
MKKGEEKFIDQKHTVSQQRVLEAHCILEAQTGACAYVCIYVQRCLLN